MTLIAMSREMGSLGMDVAQRVAERRNQKVIYHEILDQLASKMRLRKSHVVRFLDGKSGIWEKLTTDKTSLSIYTADETFRMLKGDGVAVIRGWGAAHLLKDVPHVIRVRVCAPLALRVERMMERLGTDDRAFVENEIALSEEAQSAITRRHFGVDWRDPEHYDVVLSTERLTIDDCVEELEGFMKRERVQRTESSSRIFNDLSLQWHVRAALRHDPRTSQMNALIRAENGNVQLSGLLEPGISAADAIAVAAAVEGVKKVSSDLKELAGTGSRYKREA
jgi:cytidylate kinase